jgi:hypothetical protein
LKSAEERREESERPFNPPHSTTATLSGILRPAASMFSAQLSFAPLNQGGIDGIGADRSMICELEMAPKKRVSESTSRVSRYIPCYLILPRMTLASTASANARTGAKLVSTDAAALERASAV